MKKVLCVLTVLITLVVTSGCVSTVTRLEEGRSFYKTSGVNGHDHPYRATKEMWDCVCLPFGDNSGAHPILYGIVCFSWPFWFADEVLEATVDTVFLPIDIIGAASSRQAKVKIDFSKPDSVAENE